MNTPTLKPLVSEKTLALTESGQTYVFLVSKKLNKAEVSQAVSRQFKVKVAGVTTATVKGKPKNAIVQRGRRRLNGQRRDYKKAYVKLAAGESIKLFDEPKAGKTKEKKDK